MRIALPEDAPDGTQKRILVYALTVARSGGGVEDLLRILVGMAAHRPPIDSAVETLNRGGRDHASRRALELLRLSLATGLFRA